MDRGKRRLAVLGLLVLLAVTAGCSRPAPETEVVCDECVDAMSAVAERTNRSVAVGESATHMYLNGSGDPRVEGRVTLDGSGVEEFRTNETLLELVTTELTDGDEALSEDGYSRPAFDRRGVSVSMEGRDLLVSYRTPEVTEPATAGTVVSDRFYRQKGEGRADELDFDEPMRIETDRFVVHGPDGTDPLVEPPGATARDGRVVWTGDSISTRTYLVFAPPGTPDALATVVTTVDVLTWAGPPAAWGAALAWLPLGLTLAVCLRYTGRIEATDGWSPTNDALCKLVVVSPVAFGVAIVGTVLVGGWLPSVAVLVAVVATVVYAIQRSTGTNPSEADELPVDEAVPAGRSETPADGDADRPRLYYEDTATTLQRVTPDVVATRRARRRTSAVAVTLAAALLVTVAVATDYSGEYAGTIAGAAWLLSLVAFPVVGYAVVDRGRVWVRWTAAAAVLAGAWVAAFARVVDVGAHGESGTWLVILLALAVSYAGALLFYAALWASTR
ncbi:hypothetical protein I7X12_03660 [Halosimplex litoreum]|uniref:Uncharacterized protein n=1 Tax=Halosimplex litoreum TaxID=1198301 RepID=A0A7T3FZS8_9EURY|nr:hypothetical protein [Halosimplex litoreum]QPV63740.1 hypothetical protein I7X12_03660 [Halosimplex litoreum]